MSAARVKQTRVSLVRVGILLVAILVMAAGVRWIMAPGLAVAPTPEASVFAGYVDVTATPTYQFEAPADSPQSNVILAFIVAGKENPCEPTWGTYYSMDAAATQLDLDRRIAQLRSIGGDVSVSFGGQINDELAVVCRNVDALTDAYASVVDRYTLSSIDLDIEGPALADIAALERRAQAIAALQAEAVAGGRELQVWLTLPVATQGLTAEGVAAVEATLAGGVDIAGVNGMTMNFGGSKSAGQSMAGAVEDAASALHRQVVAAYAGRGIGLDGEQAWRKVGITPMIGQNDLPGEVFTLDDAAAVNTFALENGVGLLSMWSLNRDATCTSPLPKTVPVVQTSCSGIDQDGRSFADVLANGADVAVAEPSASGAAQSQVDPVVVDDPDTSPFPIWDPVGTYPAGTRVVWKREVYRAKYWTSGISPDTPSPRKNRRGRWWVRSFQVTSRHPCPRCRPTRIRRGRRSRSTTRVSGCRWDGSRTRRSGGRRVSLRASPSLVDRLGCWCRPGEGARQHPRVRQDVAAGNDWRRLCCHRITSQTARSTSPMKVIALTSMAGSETNVATIESSPYPAPAMITNTPSHEGSQVQRTVSQPTTTKDAPNRSSPACHVFSNAPASPLARAAIATMKTPA